ncbi:MAG: RdgB/HAM1 family non-canonical purine NTP pyrophosphatase [Acidobacteriota bacterium]|nr:RdgB/HAM1 family non-canonical purine NTP pyrophosphatase [Acidobacteriota bacterium]
MKGVFCATTNAGKLREFSLALAVEVLPGLDRIPAPCETGVTFEENAVLKALYYSKHCSGLLFAEDSGLEVNALDGAPGVYSARFAGEAASDEENNRLLLARMQGVANRSARFVSVIALARAGELVKTFTGVAEGLVLEAARGENGFGYDPVFYYPPFGCSFGEATLEQKMSVSHRSQAARAMKAAI